MVINCIRLPSVLGVLAVSAVVAGGAEPASLKSRWTTSAMTVDGAPDEWPALAAVAPRVTAAAANDDRTLRLIVATSDRPLQERLMTSGLMVLVRSAAAARRAAAGPVPGWAAATAGAAAGAR